MADSAEVQIEYVGFWARVLAAVVDSICALMIIVPVIVWVYGPGYLSQIEGKLVAGPVDFLVQYLLPAVAVVLFWLARGATPGKMVIGARIVDADTLGDLGTGQAILRYIGYYISMIPLCLGLIWVGIDARKQGWHDKIAGTLVIKAR
ncbi:MAG: RDD family protein [Betaproteobacteria bacterium]